MTGSLGCAIVASFDERSLDALAHELAPRLWAQLEERLVRPPLEHDGYRNPTAAAQYLGVKRKRVYDLKSAGQLVPDGYDGRTPLFSRETLDAYVRSSEGRRVAP